MASGAAGAGALRTSRVKSKKKRAACFGDKSFHIKRLTPGSRGLVAPPKCFNCAAGATPRGASAAKRAKQPCQRRRQLGEKTPPLERRASGLCVANLVDDE
jgi:hypothetical protein